MATQFSPPVDDPADRMTREEAAKYLGVSASFLGVDVVTKKHKVPYYNIGRRCVYSRAMLREWMMGRVVNAPIPQHTHMA